MQFEDVVQYANDRLQGALLATRLPLNTGATSDMGRTTLHLGSLSSEQDALNRLNAEVEAAFGARTDDGRAIILASAAEALWVLSQQSLEGTEAEPDFIGADAVKPS